MLAFWLAPVMSAQQIPTCAPPSAPAPVRVEKFNWQAPPDPSLTAPKPQKAMKKGSGKTKWIVIAAAAGAAAASLVVLNKRLGNEGKGIF